MADTIVKIAKRGVITLPKSIRDQYGLVPGDVLRLMDLGGVFVLDPKQTEVDALADRLDAQWSKEGQTLESMLAALREERDARAT